MATSMKRSLQNDCEIEVKRFKIEPRSFLDFSDCVLLKILSFLKPYDLYCLSKTCQRFKYLISERKLWRKVDVLDQPMCSRKFKFFFDNVNNSTDTILVSGISKKEKTLTFAQFIKLNKLCDNLTILAIENQYINSDEIGLKDFPESLKELSLRGTHIYGRQPFLRDAHLKLINLHTLILADCKWFHEHSLMALSKLRSLENLSLYKCANLNDSVAYMSITAKFGFRKLLRIDARCTAIGDQFLKCFHCIKTLREIYLEAPVRRVRRRARTPRCGVLDQLHRLAGPPGPSAVVFNRTQLFKMRRDRKSAKKNKRSTIYNSPPSRNTMFNCLENCDKCTMETCSFIPSSQPCDLTTRPYLKNGAGFVENLQKTPPHMLKFPFRLKCTRSSLSAMAASNSSQNSQNTEGNSIPTTSRDQHNRQRVIKIPLRLQTPNTTVSQQNSQSAERNSNPTSSRNMQSNSQRLVTLPFRLKNSKFTGFVNSEINSQQNSQSAEGNSNPTSSRNMQSNSQRLVKIPFRLKNSKFTGFVNSEISSPQNSQSAESNSDSTSSRNLQPNSQHLVTIPFRLKNSKFTGFVNSEINSEQSSQNSQIEQGTSDSSPQLPSSSQSSGTSFQSAVITNSQEDLMALNLSQDSLMNSQTNSQLSFISSTNSQAIPDSSINSPVITTNSQLSFANSEPIPDSSINSPTITANSQLSSMDSEPIPDSSINSPTITANSQLSSMNSESIPDSSMNSPVILTYSQLSFMNSPSIPDSSVNSLAISTNSQDSFMNSPSIPDNSMNSLEIPTNSQVSSMNSPSIPDNLMNSPAIPTNSQVSSMNSPSIPNNSQSLFSDSPNDGLGFSSNSSYQHSESLFDSSQPISSNSPSSGSSSAVLDQSGSSTDTVENSHNPLGFVRRPMEDEPSCICSTPEEILYCDDVSDTDDDDDLDDNSERRRARSVSDALLELEMLQADVSDSGLLWFLGAAPAGADHPGEPSALFRPPYRQHCHCGATTNTTNKNKPDSDGAAPGPSGYTRHSPPPPLPPSPSTCGPARLKLAQNNSTSSSSDSESSESEPSRPQQPLIDNVEEVYQVIGRREGRDLRVIIERLDPGVHIVYEHGGQRRRRDEQNSTTQLKVFVARGYKLITNQALRSLVDLRLDLLDVTGTSVSAAGVKDFLMVNPDCRVIHESTCQCGYDP